MRLPLAILFSTAAWAQSIMDPSAFPRLVSRLEPRWDDQELACSVSSYGPALNYSFRIQAGYMVRIPMDQFAGPRHGWFIIIRVTPQGGDGKPVYLASRTRLPVVPRTKAEVEIGGGYLLGEGQYQVRWLMVDDRGRVCRKDWRIEAKLSRAERRAKVAMRPYTIAAFSLVGSPKEHREHDDTAPFHLTILMHAAPIFPRRTHFRVSDRMLLLSSLGAMLERIPAKSVRLVVFNLDQQKEMYRKDGFEIALLDQVAQSMNDLELNSVDVKVLEKPKGHVDLLADLVNRELHGPQASDAVVFLGPSTRFEDKLPNGAVEKPELLPKFFYFQYRPLLRRVVSSGTDSITAVVNAFKGRTMIIYHPADFAKAIDQLEKLAPPPPPASKP